MRQPRVPNDLRREHCSWEWTLDPMEMIGRTARYQQVLSDYSVEWTVGQDRSGLELATETLRSIALKGRMCTRLLVPQEKVTKALYVRNSTSCDLHDTT